MVQRYFSGQTLDDVMRDAIDEILLHGEHTDPGRGPATELTGVLLELKNPRARLSRTETRGKSFSCLGELCWYLGRTNDAEFISYYIPEYRKDAEGDVIFGGYGPRLFDLRGANQVANVLALLNARSNSRRAVIQLFDAADIAQEHKDVPCTCTLQFMLRGGKLHMFTCMRSNDAFWGLPHDVFCFTMLQEIMARTLSVELGEYWHAVGSLHVYDSKRDAAQQFIAEGWQATDKPMPPMPAGDPWPAIERVLNAETAIRREGAASAGALDDLDPYWADLVRLLQVFRYTRDKEGNEIKTLRERMASDVFRTFIEMKLSQLQ